MTITPSHSAGLLFFYSNITQIQFKYIRSLTCPCPYLRLNHFSESLTVMFKSTFAILALIASSIAAPAPEFVVERRIVEVYKRQADISQLLQL